MDYFKQTLKTDCEDLLARFQTTASVRFEEFSAIWREMKFSSIFYGILEPNEKKVFTRLVLSAASQYLLPPYSFQIRVGGLYLLYSLYTSQFNVPKERIRIALKDWDELIRFQQDAVNAQHYDVVYILKKLLSEQAVCFTAMPDTLSFQVKKKRVDRRQQLCESFVDRPTRPQELIGTDLLEELANVHEHYEGLKKAILPRPPQSDLSLIKPNLVPKLRSAVLTFCSWQLFYSVVAVGAGAAVAVAAAPLVVSAMGFTAGGIAAGSVASSMMSAAAVANGGGVVAGGVVAVLQSVGAAGLSAAGQAVVAATGATVAKVVESYISPSG